MRFLDNTECIYGLGFWLPLQEGFHLALPDWTNGSVYPDALTQLTALSFEINVMTREMQRIKGGNQFCFTSPTKTEKRLHFFLWSWRHGERLERVSRPRLPPRREAHIESDRNVSVFDEPF